MTDTALQRTSNCGLALIVLPLSSLVIGFVRWLWSDTYGASPLTAFGRLAIDVVPILLFLGAFAYLPVSGGYGLVGWLAVDTDTDA